MRWLAWTAVAVAAILLAAMFGIWGYGQWSQNACFSDPRARDFPEGSGSSQKAVKWPPAGLECTVRLPGGRTVTYVTTPY